MRGRLRAWHWNVIVSLLIGALYAGAIVVGLRVGDLSIFGFGRRAMNPRGGAEWRAPRERDIPTGEVGDRIRRGELLFDETPLYAAKFTHSRITCANCHAEGGMQPFASPMVGLPALFPMFNERAGHTITLKDRIQECFVRSENGTPLDYEGMEMEALVEYINWLSRPEPGAREFVGRGLVSLPDLQGDAVRGEGIYKAQCEGCHGKNGEGRRPLFPPLWGPDSFNDGAGMNGVKKMAAFVQHNMPQNRMGILSAQDAYDVSVFIHAQKRPAFNKAYSKF